jgi:hypothetical protein
MELRESPDGGRLNPLWNSRCIHWVEHGEEALGCGRTFDNNSQSNALGDEDSGVLVHRKGLSFRFLDEHISSWFALPKGGALGPAAGSALES